jgi:hypothetical protein
LGAAENGKPSAASLKREDNVDDLVNRITRTLEKGHCFFADLLEKFPKADYKSIGSAVARLYEEGKIAQDSEGKFQLKAPEISPAA